MTILFENGHICCESLESESLDMDFFKLIFLFEYVKNVLASLSCLE